MKRLIVCLLVLILVPSIGMAKIFTTKNETDKKYEYSAKSSYSVEAEEDITIEMRYSTSYTYEVGWARDREYFGSGAGVYIKGLNDKNAYDGVSEIKYKIDDGEVLALKIYEDYSIKQKPRPALIKYDPETKILEFHLHSNKLKKMRPESKVMFFIPISEGREVEVTLSPEATYEWSELLKIDWRRDASRFSKGQLKFQKENK